MDEANEPMASSKDIAHITEAINQLLSFTSCPHQCHGYVYTLVGISSGAREVTIMDEGLAMRVRGDAQSITKGALTKWIQRIRNDFDEWQRNLGVVFIEYTPGGRNRTGYYSSHYKLPIIQYATTVINTAKKGGNWETDPQLEIGIAAMKVIDELKASPIFLPPKQSRSGYYQSEVSTSLKTARAKFERALKYLEDNDRFLSRQDEQIVQEIEELIRRLKQRLES